MDGVRGVWILCALLGSSGCDVVFRLDRVSGLPSDALDNDPDGDAPPQTGCDDGAHDEDGDGVADACDTCPGIPDDQNDSDGDGVGDLCDPNPLASNEIVLFVSFADTNLWKTVSGNWPRDGESLLYDALTLDAYGITLYQGTPPEPPYVLEYYFTVDNIQAQGSGVAVILDANAEGQGVTCGIQRHEQPVRDVVRNTFGQASISSETSISSVMTTVGYRVTATYDRDDDILCAVTPDSNSSGGTTQLDLPQKPVPGTFGFRSLRVGLHLHYVAIYKER